MRTLKRILPILITASFFIACESSNARLCQFIEQETNRKKEDVRMIQNKIEAWNENGHRRMNFIKMHFKRFIGPLKAMENAILNNSKDSLLINKTELMEEIDKFERWIRLDQWQNIDFYWLLKKAKQALISLEFDTDYTCRNQTFLSFLNSKEDFLTTLYLAGYTDEHIFSKFEPYAMLSNPNFKVGDSTRINCYILAYDSTRVYELTYWVNDSSFNPETATYSNNFENYVSGKKGLNTIYGIHTSYQYGKVFNRKWEATFEVY